MKTEEEEEERSLTSDSVCMCIHTNITCACAHARAHTHPVTQMCEVSGYDPPVFPGCCFPALQFSQVLSAVTHFLSASSTASSGELHLVCFFPDLSQVFSAPSFSELPLYTFHPENRLPLCFFGVLSLWSTLLLGDRCSVVVHWMSQPFLPNC